MKNSICDRSTGRVEFVCDEANLTPAAGLVTVAELDRVLGISATIDSVVGPLARPGARGRPYGAADVVVGFAESQLAGGDFMVDIDARRADVAGAQLRAVANPPASTTAGALAQRFGGKGLVRLGRAVGILARRSFDVLADPERCRLLAVRPTLDVDPTEVECYGKKKDGFAWNYQGQWAARPCPVVWAEAGLVVAGKLLRGNQDPRPPARRLVKKAVAALPEGLGPPRFRFDSGFFDNKLARACLDAGADYAMAVPRNKRFWKAVGAIRPDAWVPARDMDGAEIAEACYVPKGWPGTPRAIVRRVRVEAADIKVDPRSRRLRTIGRDELKAVREGRADHAYSYSMILTSLDNAMADLEHWFRRRAQIEERLKDSKHGTALRHLPSGYKVVNGVWMWSAFLALNISATLCALARRPDTTVPPDQAGPSNGTDPSNPLSDGPGAPHALRARRRPPLRSHGKRMRREIINVPGRLARHARSLKVHIHPCHLDGPLLRVYRALRLLPSFAGP